MIIKYLRHAMGLISRWLLAVVLAISPPAKMLVIKRLFASLFVDKIGAGVIISPGFFAFDGRKLNMGSRGSFGYWFRIFDFEPVSIGDDLLASHNVTLIAGTHKNDAARTYLPGPISIGRNVWIGAGVTIVGPCVIGDNCVIGANSFVKGEFPAGSVIGGSPAKLLRISKV